MHSAEHWFCILVNEKLCYKRIGLSCHYEHTVDGFIFVGTNFCVLNEKWHIHWVQNSWPLYFLSLFIQKITISWVLEFVDWTFHKNCENWYPTKFKADMNSDKGLQTAAIFFSDELLSETWYWLGVCHGWFHLHRLPLAARSGSEIYKMKNSSYPQRDSNSRPSDWEAIALSTRPRRPVL